MNGYLAATQAVAVFERGDRSLLTVSGKAPGKMLRGVVTGVIPEPPTEVEDGVFGGEAKYNAVLTPKGKMVSDLWAMLPAEEEDPGFLFDVPVSGRDALVEHLGKLMPPRFARVEDISESWRALSVVGPRAPELLSRMALGLRLDEAWFRDAEEGAWRRVGRPSEGLLIMRTCDVWPEAWTVYGPTTAVSALSRALADGGAEPADAGVWETLRVEAGRPAFGADMNDRTIPPEAGIVERAIDQTKGCYTGQEVIVRIRDRGHVNRQLRQLDLGDAPVPPIGSELQAVDDPAKIVGEVTSAVHSPKFGGSLAMAYVRRGVDRALIGGREIVIPSDS